MIKIGKHEFFSGAPRTVGENFCRWDKRGTVEIEETYQSIKRFPTVYFYLMDGDYPICYYRTSMLEFTDPNAKINWVEFDPDLAVGYVKEVHKAGLFSFRLFAHNLTDDGRIDLTQYAVWKKDLPKRYNAHRLRVAIY